MWCLDKWIYITLKIITIHIIIYSEKEKKKQIIYKWTLMVEKPLQNGAQTELQTQEKWKEM